MGQTLTHATPGRGTGGLRCVLVLAFEAERPLEPGLRLDLRDLDVVEIGRGERRELERTTSPGERRVRLGVPDRWMSGTHARLMRVMGHWLVEDAGSKNGTRLRGVPVQRETLDDRAVVECGHTFFVFREHRAVPRAIELGPGPDEVGGLATFSVPFGAELARLASVTRSDVPVLLRGETGTGKEVAARAVHTLSQRAGAFVAVNCGGLPANLVEAELFGSRKGAFTGAEGDREGLVRAAHGGTLFLDEVGDLPLGSQPAFLRVLQEREVLPVGATKAVPVDFRLVAATHRDLEGMTQDERFRADLLARVSGFTLALPPLRDRPEDLGLLLQALLPRAGASAAVRLGCEAARALMLHHWPFNVRELERALGAALALAETGPVALEHLPAELRRPDAPGSPLGPALPKPGPSVPTDPEDAALRARLVGALAKHRGNVSAVARELGKARMQIQRWLRRFDLDPETFRGE
jgi:transcriptional regulator of acetoin/glycerol metabolism